MNLLATALSVTPIPEPVIDDTWYSPGVIGFIATFTVVAGAVLLIFDIFDGSNFSKGDVMARVTGLGGLLAPSKPCF